MSMNKTQHLHIRISEKDKRIAMELADEHEMSLSEFVVYLIRREADHNKSPKN